MSQSVIPQPEGHKIVSVGGGVCLGVDMGNAHVTLFHNYAVIRFSIDRNRRNYYCHDLEQAARADGVLGTMVLEMSIDCGGSIYDPETKASGTLEDFELVRQALPWFYPEIHEREMRKVLRAVYRRVENLCSAVPA